MRRVTYWTTAAALVVAAGCGSDEAANANGRGGPGGRGGAPQFPVEVVTVTEEQVEYAVNGVGSVAANETVSVTTRISGVIERVRFREGQNVRAGDTLAEIEPDRYRIAVEAARASVAKADAELREARAGLARRQSIIDENPGLIRGEEVETWRTRTSTAAADLSQARASLQQAELNLRDAFVRAPLSGVIQSRNVQTGQYVQPGTLVATLVDRDPLLVRFQIPEAEAARVQTGMPASFSVPEDQRGYTAQISWVAASANEESRMVEIIAQVTDPARDALRPGAFARVTVPIPGAGRNPVIPQTAIRPSERGFLAFVVEGNVARERTLGLGLRTPDGRVEVVKGLQTGDRLVVRGSEALRDGAQVRIAGEEPSSPRNAG